MSLNNILALRSQLAGLYHQSRNKEKIGDLAPSKNEDSEQYFSKLYKLVNSKFLELGNSNTISKWSEFEEAITTWKKVADKMKNPNEKISDELQKNIGTLHEKVTQIYTKILQGLEVQSSLPPRQEEDRDPAEEVMDLMQNRANRLVYFSNRVTLSWLFKFLNNIDQQESSYGRIWQAFEDSHAIIYSKEAMLSMLMYYGSWHEESFKQNLPEPFHELKDKGLNFCHLMEKLRTLSMETFEALLLDQQPNVSEEDKEVWSEMNGVVSSIEIKAMTSTALIQIMNKYYEASKTIRAEMSSQIEQPIKPSLLNITTLIDIGEVDLAIKLACKFNSNDNKDEMLQSCAFILDYLKRNQDLQRLNNCNEQMPLPFKFAFMILRIFNVHL